MMIVDPFRFAGGGGGFDPNFANVYMLSHLDASDGSNLVMSQGPGLVFAGSASLAGAGDAKFGDGAAYLPGADGSGLQTSTVNPNHWDVDFCIELQIKPASVLGSRYLFNTHTESPAGVAIFTADAKIQVLASYNGTSWAAELSGDVLSPSVYQHIAVSRASGVLRAFVNGVKCIESAPDMRTLASSIGSIRIGRGYYSGDFFAGHIDELRFTVGVARYTANFTPPTAPFPDGL
jgi:hypothetical protein